MNVTRPAAVIDLESTGPRPDIARIVQVAVILLHPGDEPVERVRLINPGVPIPPEVTAIHGITDDDVREAPRFAAVAQSLAEMLEGRDLIGYGITRFDVPLLVHEFARYGVDWEPSGAVIDALRIFHEHEPRDLAAALGKYCEEAHENAHDALADARAALAVLDAQTRYYGLPADPDELGQLYDDPERVHWTGVLRRRADGQIVMRIGRYAGEPVTFLSPSYVQWMRERGQFPAAVLAIIDKERATAKVPA